MRAAAIGDAIGALVARDLAGRADVGWRWDALRLPIAQ
jgi:YD repeat-containing protein